METLKNIRSRIGASQSDFAKSINTSVPNYSNYENGLALPCLEDCVILEHNVSERIVWKDNVSPTEKQKIVEGIITLFKLYPVVTVLNFAQRAIKEGIRLGKPTILIEHFSNAAKGLEPEPLLPPNTFKRTKTT